MAKHALAKVSDDIKRGAEIFLVPPALITIRDGWNARTDFSGEDELVAYIRENGVPGNLEVVKTEANQLELIDGERRLRAVRRLNDEGAEIRMVSVEVAKKGKNEADLYLDHMTRNAGKPFTPTEEAACYRRLMGWGFTPQDISDRTGKSVSHIRNRLDLAAAGPEIKAAVDAGELPVTKAQQIVKAAKGSIDAQSDGLKKARKAPKRNKLILSFKDGRVRRSGMKDASCSALEFMMDEDLRLMLTQQGFDPDTLRISVERAQQGWANGL